MWYDARTCLSARRCMRTQGRVRGAVRQARGPRSGTVRTLRSASADRDTTAYHTHTVSSLATYHMRPRLLALQSLQSAWRRTPRRCPAGRMSPLAVVFSWQRSFGPSNAQFAIRLLGEHLACSLLAARRNIMIMARALQIPKTSPGEAGRAGHYKVRCYGEEIVPKGNNDGAGRATQRRQGLQCLHDPPERYSAKPLVR